MKLHFISRGYAVPLAYQAARQGCAVTAHIADGGAGEGMFPLVPNAAPTGKPDAVIVDGAGWGKLVDELTKDGQRVLFGGAWAELLALKPEYNRKLLAKTGLPVAERNALRYELLIGGWYDGGFTPPYYAAVIRDRLLAGDVGALSGRVAAEVIALEPNAEPVNRLLRPLELALDEVDYRGLLSLTVTPTPDGIAALRIVAGVQPLLIEALAELHRDGLCGVMDAENMETGTDCAVALGLSMPPWPYSVFRPEKPIEVTLDEGQARHFWPLDVTAEDGKIIYNAQMGVLGTVTARGRPQQEGDGHCWFDQAGYRARTMAGRLGAPDVQYRADIGYRSAQAMEPLFAG